jgi:hypothetical protein
MADWRRRRKEKAAAEKAAAEKAAAEKAAAEKAAAVRGAEASARCATRVQRRENEICGAALTPPLSR